MARLQRKKTAPNTVPAVVIAAEQVQAPRVARRVFKLRPIKVAVSEVKYIGSELDFPVDRILTKTELGKQFNWYSHVCELSDSREFVEQLVLSMPRRQHLVARYKSLPDWHIGTSAGWIARLIMRGAHVPYSSLRHLVRTLRNAEAAYQRSQVVNMATVNKLRSESKAQQQTTIQDRLREKLGECIGEIEAQIDEFWASGFKTEVRAFELLKQFNIHQNHVSGLADWAKPKLDEMQLLLAVLDQKKRSSSEEQLVEGYKNLGKRQIKAVIEMWQKIIDAANSYGQVKKAERAPRKRKPVAPEKQVRKIKYLKKDPETGVESIDLVKIVGASEIWTYNTKTRKLGVYVADDYSKVLTVKGAGLLGYSEKHSVQKTLRKPVDQLKQFMVLGKPAAHKFLGSIKTSEIKLNGRFNEHTVILRAYK